MFLRILLIQDDAAAAKVVIDSLSHSTDARFQIDWVRRCSEGLERLSGTAAILADLCLADSRGITTFERVFRAASRDSNIGPG